MFYLALTKYLPVPTQPEYLDCGSLQAALQSEICPAFGCLILELKSVHNESTYKKIQTKYANPILLSIDE